MNIEEAAEKCNVAKITLRIWCKNNDIKRVLGKQGVMEYDLTNKDLEKFKKRRPKGRPKTSNK
jgi:predicted site-specific integrase-resolvase